MDGTCKWCEKVGSISRRGLCNACAQKWRRRYGPSAKWEVKPCPTCGETFVTTRGKLFCSLPCFVKGEKFRAARKRYAEETAAKRVARQCLECGTEFKVMPCLAKPQEYGGKKRREKLFCNRKCHRRYFASRFDRFVEAANLIGKPVNYDEFLAQEELPCVVEGCDWKGHNLAIHCNHVHGIPAALLKEKAGFNAETGLISETAYENFMAAQREREDEFLAAIDVPVSTHDRSAPRIGWRPEGRQRRMKTLALRQQPLAGGEVPIAR